jgi:hypothetical protein
MRISSLSSLLAAAAMTAAFSLAAPALAEQQMGASVPKSAYPNATLTTDEQSAIAEEESVTPNDGRPSVPPPLVKGIIPDAADEGTVAEPATPKSTTTAESETEVILKDAQKNDRVTHTDISDCMRQWDPQTQMTREEWAASCRTTLQYFPDKTGN